MQVPMKAKKTKICANCKCAFFPDIHLPNQVYCSAAKCQKIRKAKWMRSKLRYDKDYRDNKKMSQSKWCSKNQDYWKKYRKRTKHSEYNEIKGKNKQYGDVTRDKSEMLKTEAHIFRVFIKDVGKLIKLAKTHEKNLTNYASGIFS